MVTHDLLYINIDFTSPVLITGLVFVGLFAILSILDCFLGKEREMFYNICENLMLTGPDGWYLIDLKQAQDAKHYFGKIPSILSQYL